MLTRGTGQAEGRLPETILYFCRLLRHAGVPLGAGRVLAALQAVAAVGLESRADFRAALRASLVSRPEHLAVFDQAFHLFWRNPHLLERSLSLLLPSLQRVPSSDPDPVTGRLAEAFAGRRATAGRAEQEVEFNADLTFCDRELLQTRDFDAMTTAEFDEAKAAIAQMWLSLPPRVSRRYAPGLRGARIDGRACLKSLLKPGGEAALFWRKPVTRPSPLVVLSDISGSMGRYSRILLHFVHALSSDRDRVSSFLFGTRLTNITRHLKYRDVDRAVAAVSTAVADWAGGTRIGACLAAFNRDWSRRVLGQGAIVLLITDGLDLDGGDNLAREVERLHKSCRRLVWLNPLLRYDKFEPKALGIRAMLPHVDAFCPVHNLASLRDLAESLGKNVGESRRGWVQ